MTSGARKHTCKHIWTMHSDWHNYKCAPLSPYLLARSSRCAGQILEERKQKWEGGNTLFHLCCHCAWNCCWMQGTDPIHCSILPFLWTFQTEPQNWLEEESQMKALLYLSKGKAFLFWVLLHPVLLCCSICTENGREWQSKGYGWDQWGQGEMDAIYNRPNSTSASPEVNVQKQKSQVSHILKRSFERFFRAGSILSLTPEDTLVRHPGYRRTIEWQYVWVKKNHPPSYKAHLFVWNNFKTVVQ